MPNGHHNGDKDGEFEGRTYLYIRTHPADNGSEPLAAGLPGWVSPDIVVIKPGGAVGGEAEAGKANQVRVTVTNAGGIQATDAWVDAFVADPSTAFTPLTATPIGADYLTIAPYSTANISFPWTPLVGTPEHACLLARVRLIVPPDGYVNGAIFDVVGDRHVAQRNIHIVPIASDQEAMSFGFQIVNPGLKAGAFLVQARQLPANENQETLRGAVGCELAHFGNTPLGDVGLQLGKRIPQPNASVSGRERRFPTMGRLEKPVMEAQERDLALKLLPGEARAAVITLTRNPNTLSGELQVVEIRQVDAETQQIVGGLWVVLRQE